MLSPSEHLYNTLYRICHYIYGLAFEVTKTRRALELKYKGMRPMW
jgi:hypothetical protein